MKLQKRLKGVKDIPRQKDMRRGGMIAMHNHDGKPSTMSRGSNYTVRLAQETTEETVSSRW